MTPKPLNKFRIENTEPDAKGRYVDLRTLRKWPGAFKIESRWYMDMDVWNNINKEKQSTDSALLDLADGDIELLKSLGVV